MKINDNPNECHIVYNRNATDFVTRQWPDAAIHHWEVKSRVHNQQPKQQAPQKKEIEKIRSDYCP